MAYEVIIFDKSSLIQGGDKIIHDPCSQKLIPGAAQRLRELQKSMLHLALISSHPEVAEGYKLPSNAIAEVNAARRTINSAIGVDKSRLMPDHHRRFASSETRQKETFYRLSMTVIATSNSEAVIQWTFSMMRLGQSQQKITSESGFCLPSPGMIESVVQVFAMNGGLPQHIDARGVGASLPRYRQEYYTDALSQVLVIGTEQAQQAAASAGVDFCWAADWIANGIPGQP